MTDEENAMIEAYRQAGKAACLKRTGISIKIGETTAFDKIYPPIVDMRGLMKTMFIPIVGYANWTAPFRAIDRANCDRVEWHRARRRRKHRI